MRKLIYLQMSPFKYTISGEGVNIKGTVTNFNCFMPQTRKQFSIKYWSYTRIRKSGRFFLNMRKHRKLT